jgi:hypothetical protein
VKLMRIDTSARLVQHCHEELSDRVGLLRARSQRAENAGRRPIIAANECLNAVDRHGLRRNRARI